MSAEEQLIRLLTRLRDARLVWDVMGSLYNRRIHAAIAGLCDHVTGDMPLSPGARLLDAGCGPGHAALQLARRNPGAMITGIDYSPMQVRAARKLQGREKIPNCAFERGDAMNLGFADGTFDAAVSIGSIKHWPDPQRGLGEIRRILKTGGVALISETDRDATDEGIRRFMANFGAIGLVPERLFFWGLRSVVFGRSFTEESLAEALRRAGYGRIDCSREPSCPYIIVKGMKLPGFGILPPV